MDELIAVTLGSLAGSAIGAFSLLKWLVRREVSKAALPSWTLTTTTSFAEPAEGHIHRFDTMFGDGAGWRCGICGEPKVKE
jgi:hypothetical protein